MFGIDITNYSSKRNKLDTSGVDSSINWKLNQKVDMPMHNRQGDLENVHERIKLDEHSKHSSKGIVFGPFAPVNWSGFKDPEKKRLIEVQENLNSTYCPQYHNQGDLYLLLYKYNSSTFWIHIIKQIVLKKSKNSLQGWLIKYVRGSSFILFLS